MSGLFKLRNYSMKTIPKSTNNPTTTFKVLPGFGKYLIRYKYAYIFVNREKMGTASMSGGEPHEVLTLTTLAAHEHILEDIYREVYQLEASGKEGKTKVYTSKGTKWEELGDSRLKRPLGSVILDLGVKERIVSDVDKFLAAREVYKKRGIRYRRGYLLHGPPGSGKTSFIEALAGDLDYSIVVIDLAERGMTSDRLTHLLMKVPPRSIVVLEDVDVAFGNSRTTGSDGYSGPTVTMSGLLNALDGLVAGEEGRLTFLTTNFPGELDARLIRDGRVDLKVYVGNATRYQAGKIWDNFYGDMDDGTWRERFLKHLEALGYFGTKNSRFTSMAALQGLLLASEGSMEGAIMMAEERLAAPELEGTKVEPLKPEPAKPPKVDPEVGVKKRARRQRSRFYVLSPLSSRRR